MDKKLKSIYRKAYTSFKAQNYHKALELLQKTGEKAADDLDFSYLQGLCLCHTGKFQAGANFFRKVIQSEDTSFKLLQSYMIMGYISILESNYDKGEEYIYELLKRNYENAQIYALLGYVYNKRKDHAQAEYYYKKSLELDPDNANSHNGLGYNYVEWKTNLPRAFNHIQAALKLDQDNPAYLDSLGWFFFIKKNVYKAVFYLTKALRFKKSPVIEKHLRTVRGQ